MLAPIDKARRGGNDIVQVVVTRACSVFSCSNCTQLLPFRKDALHMTPGCFREAVRSLSDWPGIVAMFGGTPNASPHFEELCAILCEEVPDQRRRGLWTNDLLKHGDLIRRTFYPRGRFNLNVHGDEAAAAEMRKWLPDLPVYGESGRVHHAAMLLDRRDYGIGDEEWAALRESCDVNRNWSGAIYQGPQGRPVAYFCEVAGSLDGTRGESHGVPAVPGWWRQPMAHFAHQVAACCDRGCGVPLRGRGSQDAEAVYDVSPSWEGPCGERHGRRVELKVHAERPACVHEATDYVGLRLKKPEAV